MDADWAPARATQAARAQAVARTAEAPGSKAEALVMDAAATLAGDTKQK